MTRERRTDDGTYPEVEEEKAKLEERAAAANQPVDRMPDGTPLRVMDMSLCEGLELRTLSRAGGRYVPVWAFDKAVQVCGTAMSDGVPVYGFVAEAIAEARMKGRTETVPSTSNTSPPVACDLCGEDAAILRARCHITAPLRASLKDGVLTLSCYIPDCNREVAKFRIVNASG